MFHGCHNILSIHYPISLSRLYIANDIIENAGYILFKNLKLHVKVSRLTYLPFNRLAAPSTQAWVTLATNDSYALGALVLASSLRRTNTARKIVVMVTPEGLRYHSYIT